MDVYKRNINIKSYIIYIIYYIYLFTQTNLSVCKLHKYQFIYTIVHKYYQSTIPSSLHCYILRPHMVNVWFGSRLLVFNSQAFFLGI